METGTVLFAFGLTILAGLSTGIGSLISLFTKKTSTRMLSLALGFSAGVMLYVSFVDILPQASITSGAYAATLAFFGGIAVIMVIDRLVPSYENPHEPVKADHLKGHDRKGRRMCKEMHRTGLMVAVAITIHNFPEGIATFAGGLLDMRIGLAIAIAVAIHNIPEGVAVSMPIYCATGSRKKAIYYSFLSGLAEPLGAVFGFFFLFQFMSTGLLGMLLAAVAGIMVFISLDELLPAAREYGDHHMSVYGLIIGMGIMAISLFLFL